jgi:anti-sigma-K factor RskA
MLNHDSLQGGHGDAPSYLLGALDASARARFETHAAVCDECRRDVAELQPVTDALALAVASVEPPEHVRRRLLTRALLVPASEVAAVPLPVPPPAAAPPRRPWWRLGERAATALAAASVLVAVVSGGYAFSVRQDMQQTAQTAAQLGETLAIMYQPGVVPKLLNGTENAPQAKGKVYLVPDGTKAVVMTYDLPRLKEGEGYQCWLSNDQSRSNAGIFTIDQQGRGRWLVNAPEMLQNYRQMGVTREPARGSSWPTGPRVLLGQF